MFVTGTPVRGVDSPLLKAARELFPLIKSARGGIRHY